MGFFSLFSSISKVIIDSFLWVFRPVHRRIYGNPEKTQQTTEIILENTDVVVEA